MDYFIYEISNINYGGSERKIGIKIENEYYMIKFQEIIIFQNILDLKYLIC